MTIDPIGVIRTCFGGKFGIPRQPGLCPSAWGRLVFREGYRSAESLRGLDGFSHVWLIFGFHETVAQGWRPTVRPPRLGGNERVGVFASRSTFRPNALGLSVVRLEGVDEGRGDGPALLLGGVDLLDGSPVYDVKPYLSYADCLPNAVSGFAADGLRRLPVVIGDSAMGGYERLSERSRAVILEVLALDPRPAIQVADEGREYGADLCGCNVRFVIGGGVCTVFEISPGEGSGLNT